MPQCIFCEEGEPIELPDDCKECPQCYNPPFSGMMFDPKRKEEAARLESEGNLEGAWEILSGEWMNHTDMDYYDDEMAIRISGWIYELFERNPGMIEQRVEMRLMEMGSLHYWGFHNDALESAEDAMRIAREAGRADLEMNALERHGGIQSQRYGGIQNMPQFEEFSRYKEEVENRLEKINENRGK
jgi:hypothetical protein